MFHRSFAYNRNGIASVKNARDITKKVKIPPELTTRIFSNTRNHIKFATVIFAMFIKTHKTILDAYLFYFSLSNS